MIVNFNIQTNMVDFELYCVVVCGVKLICKGVFFYVKSFLVEKRIPDKKKTVGQTDRRTDCGSVIPSIYVV